jgi:phosphate transport system substrate-binding protein
MEMYPTAVTGLVPVHSLSNMTSADAALVLTPISLARIFSLDITRWDDPVITATNLILWAAGKLLAAPIVVIVRPDDASGQTQLIQEALARFDPGSGQRLRNSTAWANATVQSCGSDELYGIQCLLETTPGAISFTSLAMAQTCSMTAISLLLPGAAMAVRATGESVFAAVAEMSIGFEQVAADGGPLRMDPLKVTSLSAWPIQVITYLVLRKEVSSLKGRTSASGGGRRSVSGAGFTHPTSSGG